MGFHTAAFLFFFLPASFLLCLLLPGTRAKNGFLTLAGLVFYACGQWQGLPLLLASALLAWGAEQGLAFLTLEVRPSNAAAYALYRKLGFDVVGVRPNYYAHPKENALLMTHYYDKENRP